MPQRTQQKLTDYRTRRHVIKPIRFNSYPRMLHSPPCLRSVVRDPDLDRNPLGCSRAGYL